MTASSPPTLGFSRVEDLSTLIVVTNPQGTLTLSEAMSPDSIEVEIGRLKHLMRHEEPETKHGLGEDVQHRVGNDLGIDAGSARSFGDRPDADNKISRELRIDLEAEVLTQGSTAR